MGAQQAKERGGASGASMRSVRAKPRVPKDPRILGSNIFTEHSGESLFLLCELPLSSLSRGCAYHPTRHRPTNNNNILFKYIFCLHFDVGWCPFFFCNAM